MKKGFTLIELMIVMVIMGVLAVIGIQAFFSSQIKGRDSSRKGDLKAISQALELYYNDKGAYPVAAGGYMKACPSGLGAANCDGSDASHEKMWDGTTIYMTNVPSDPSAKQKYLYVSSNGSQYQLYTHLENDAANSHDPQINPDVVSQNLNCGVSSTIYCNYGISSGNVAP